LHLKADDPVIRLHDTSSDRFGQIVGIDGNLRFDADNSNAQSSTNITFRTDGTEKMRIDANGLLGLNNSSPQGELHVGKADNSNHEAMIILNNGGASGQEAGIEFRYESGTTPRAKIHVNSSDKILRFTTDTQEAMQIDSSQRLLVGTTTAFDTASGFALVQIDAAGSAGLTVTGNSTGSQTRVSFFNPNGRVGFISTDGSATVYNTSGSDKTLKKNFESWTENTLDLFKNIKPQKFNFIHDDDGVKKSKGFIAQEMVSSFPEAYTKEDKKDAKYYFNPSGMVVYLMKAIQELEAKVAALEAT